MFTILLVLHAVIAALLVAVILMQKSEGGGLGMGGSPSGLMSARGAADFLTRATAVLASLFVLFSIALAVLASTHRNQTIDTSRIRAPAIQTPPVTQPAPLAGSASSAAAVAVGESNAAAGNDTVPLAR